MMQHIAQPTFSGVLNRQDSLSEAHSTGPSGVLNRQGSLSEAHSTGPSGVLNRQGSLSEAHSTGPSGVLNGEAHYYLFILTMLESSCCSRCLIPVDGVISFS